MIVQPDDLIKQVLIGTLRALRVDPSPLRTIFQQKPPTELSEIVQFFHENEVSCKFGYPRAAADLPGLYVTIGPSSESDQVIGSEFPLQEATDQASAVSGSWFTITVMIGCMSTNAALSQWLSAVAVWALLGTRASLNKAGFTEQRINMRDLAPEQRLAPDFVFRRDLTVTGKVPATAEDYTQYATLRSIQVLPTIVLPPDIEETEEISGIGDD